MTVTDIRTARPRPEQTPESVELANIEAHLADPRYAGYRDELEAARKRLLELTATTVLAA